MTQNEKTRVQVRQVAELAVQRDEQNKRIHFAASEADLLNTVLFGMIAKEWRDSNPNEKGNIRDMATMYQLLVLSNMESYNAILIKQGKNQAERMQLLYELAVQQSS